MARTATAEWKGDLMGGGGTVALGSGAYEGAYSFATRFEDKAGANPEELLGAAHAGCLSFEMSAATQPIFVNGGAPEPAAHEWHAAARATSSHNTLCLGATSSAKLVRHDHLQSLLEGADTALAAV